MGIITSDLVHSIGHFSVPRSSDIDLLAFLMFLPSSTPLLISLEGMSSIPGHLSVFTAATTSLSVPADCPHFQWRTGWFVVWNRRCLVHSCTRHRSIMPSSSASNLVCDQLTIFIPRTADLCWLVLVRSFSPSLMPLAIVSISRSIILRAANCPPI